ncbi:hypothetical protein MSAN_00823200 [Mycena sanguinolenta]|uniref:Uncharacterized protein n=1 Tax=Mycena sanguinolenta TaxID=230812 RepID=A0A8H7D9U4_9AGAR|nr:hypothetical protein MSAN_00823200 [Mycena sanguinolenta]
MGCLLRLPKRHLFLPRSIIPRTDGLWRTLELFFLALALLGRRHRRWQGIYIPVLCSCDSSNSLVRVPSITIWLKMENRPLIFPSRKSSFDELTIESRSNTMSKRSEAEPVSVKYTRRIGWLFAVLVGQALLLALSLGMFSAVRARGYILLSPKLADFVQKNPQSKTYVVTFLSTTLSMFSSYLFSQAITQMILVYLTDPMTISTLRFGISVSSRSILFDFQNIKRLLTTGVFFLATLGQTASWSSLLTPNDITVYTPLQGTELDFSSEAFVSQFPQFYGYIGTYLSSALLSVIDTSGSTSAMAFLGYPTVLDYTGLAYNGSTGGIFPAVVDPTANKTNFFVYYDSPLPPFYTSYNVTMSQQGLTAAVSCQNRTGQLDATSDPPFQRLATPAETVISNGHQPTNYTAFSFMSACGGVTEYTYSYLSSTNDTVIALACPQNDTSGGYMNTYTVIIDSQGAAYQDMGTMVCSVSPQIQSMTSYYNGRFVYSEPDSAHAPINLQLNSSFFYGTLVEGIRYGQGTTRNAVGDAIESILTDQIAGNELVNYLTLWEAYIRGVVEFVGTAMKWHLAAPGGLLQRQPPSNLSMIKSTNGTAITTTLGWQYKQWASFAVLIPSTFVALASILIVLFTQFRSHGVPVQHAPFDPSSPVALMAAASAGGMGNTFHGMTKEDVKEGLRKKVKLGQVGGRVGFVQVESAV